MASAVLNGFTKEDEAYFRQISEEKYRLDMQAMIYDATQEVRQQGIQQGLQQGKLEIARKMKTTDFPMEQIQTITGLSLEEISHL